MAGWSERAFDAVTDLTKQIITLSTGVIALSFTFLTDLASTDSTATRGWMIGSWVVFIASIVAGIGVLMASAGHQGTAAKSQATPDILDAKNMRWLAGIQIVLFLAGLVLTAVAVSAADAPPVVDQ